MTAPQRWRCRICGTGPVADLVLSGVGGVVELHRLTCERCGAVGHYDLDRTRAVLPTQTVNGRFWTVEAAPVTSGRPSQSHQSLSQATTGGVS